MNEDALHVDPETLDRLLDRELDAAETAAALDHLSTCPACAETHGPLVEAVRLLELPTVPAATPPVRSRLAFGRVAAAALLLVIAAAWIDFHGGGVVQETDAKDPIAPARIESASLDAIGVVRVSEVSTSAAGSRSRRWETSPGRAVLESEISTATAPLVSASLTVRSSKKGLLR